MPCKLLVYDTASKTKTRYICDEDTTTRLFEDEFAAADTGEYTNVEGETFGVDWTTNRLIGFLRKSDDGGVIASGGADGSQTKIP